MLKPNSPVHPVTDPVTNQDGSKARPSLRRCERGAIYIEFLIAFMPVFTFFLSVLQLAFVYTAQVSVENAATVAARTAALSLGVPGSGENKTKTDHAVPLGAQRERVVRKAVVLALAPFILDGTIMDLDIQYPTSAAPNAPSVPTQTFAAMGQKSAPLVRTRVRGLVNCKIMLANRLVCGGLGGSLLNPTMWLQAESVFPVERADYLPASACQATNQLPL
jgi:hypothetical protein